MSLPQDWHIDAALTNYAQKYGQGSFAWAQMAPAVLVPKISNKYVKWNREEIRFGDFHARAPRTRHPQIRFGAGTGSYMTQEYGHEAPVGWEEMANADVTYNPESRAVELAKAQTNMGFENQFKTLVAASGSFGTTTGAAAAWLTATYVQLRQDIDTACEAVIVASGMAPNKLMLGPIKARELARNQNIIDIVKYQPAANLIADGSLPKTLFGLEIVVPGVIGEGAVEGQTSSPARLWNTTSAVVAHVDPNPGTEGMTWISTFTWSQFPGSAGGELVRFWDEVGPKTRIFEYAAHRDMNVVATACAARITGI